MGESKFILDTNIWISYIINDSLEDLITSIFQKDFLIYGDRHLIGEIGDVLSRPKFKKYLKAPYHSFIEVIEMSMQMIESKSRPYHLPDSKDNFLIALAHSSQTRKVVTGDKKLLAMKVYEEVEFLSLADFKKILSKR